MKLTEEPRKTLEKKVEAPVQEETKQVDEVKESPAPKKGK
jgi:hypothetical protein